MDDTEIADTETFITIDFPDGKTMSIVVDLPVAENIVGLMENLTGIKMEAF